MTTADWRRWKKDDWTRFEDRTLQWRNIRMREVEWSKFDASDVEALRSIIQIRGVRGDDMERIERMSPTAVEIVWYDDVDDEDTEGHTRVAPGVLAGVRDLLHQYFGPHWRVRWKEDDRRHGRHPQRAVIRRADHQNFTYIDEDRADYLRCLKGQPDGVSEDVSNYGEMDRYRVPHVLSGAGGADFYIYESGTGTQHIVPELRRKLVFEDVKCSCGLNINNSELINESRVSHYGEVLAELIDDAEHRGLGGWTDPNNLENLCERCWRSYSNTRGTGSRTPPVGDFKRVLSWAAGDQA